MLVTKMAMAKSSIVLVFLAVGLYLIRPYMNGCEYKGSTQIEGKVVIITGANTGIGKETALDLARRGGRVYLACRSLSKAQHAVQEIKASTGVGDDRLIVMHLDLMSLKSVRQFAQAFRKREKRLDLLINNAGIMFVPQNKTEDGFEQHLGVNHLSHFLLTHLLSDLLVTSAPSRIVNVASLAHMIVFSIDFDDMMLEKSYNRFWAYGQSKAANILFTRELARRLEGTGVTTYSLHPGSVWTELLRNTPLFNIPYLQDILWKIIQPIMKDVRHGAQTSLCCALDESLAKESGKYYDNCVEVEPNAASQNDEYARELWTRSVQWVGLQPEETHPKLRD